MFPLKDRRATAIILQIMILRRHVQMDKCAFYCDMQLNPSLCCSWFWSLVLLEHHRVVSANHILKTSLSAAAYKRLASVIEQPSYHHHTYSFVP